MFLTLFVLRKHTESMYLICFTQSPVTQAPLETERTMSLHQPSTRAERSLGRFSHESESHCPSERHSFSLRARAGLSLEGWAAVTPVGLEGESAFGTLLPQAVVHTNANAMRLAFIALS